MKKKTLIIMGMKKGKKYFKNDTQNNIRIIFIAKSNDEPKLASQSLRGC